MSDPQTLRAEADVSAATPARSARIGDLDRGVVALAQRGAVTEFPGGTTVSWWVGGDDRWYLPAEEATTRDRLVGGAPVVESAVRIPSGDALGRVAVVRRDGAPRPSIAVEVDNESPLPVALAWVVESARPMSVVGAAVVVDGVGTLELTRPAMGWLTAGSAAELAAALADGVEAGSAPTGSCSGVVAALVPLPHTARAVVTFTPGWPGETGDAGPTADAPLDRTLVPAIERVVAGWAVHTAAGPRVDWVDPRRGPAFAAATCDVLLGPPEAAAARDLAERATALGRLGRVDDLEPLHDLLDQVRANGSLPDPVDPVVATVDLVVALTSWWAAGLDPSIAVDLLGPLAEAVRWLDRRRRRAAVAACATDATDALARAAAWFESAGQGHVAAAVREHVDTLLAVAPVTAGPTARRDLVLLGALGDGLGWGTGGPDPDPRWSARFVRWALDGVVADRGGILDLLPGWQPSDAGTSFEAHDVPTSLGSLSFGIRWHGDRPALLWEVTPWPDRPWSTSHRLTSSSIDPAWSATERAGEALLAAPAATPPAETTPPVETGESPDLGSFS